MQGIIFERGIVDFLLITCFLGGGAAFLTGRAVALTWRHIIYLVVYLLLLTCGVRFVHYALFEGTLRSLHFFLVDLVVILALGWLGFQMTRARQMAGQYSWLYRRVGPIAWQLKGDSAG